MTDPIADLLTRIRNALTARHEKVEMPGSRIKRAIVAILKREGYIDDFGWSDDDKQGTLIIHLKAVGEWGPVPRGLKRISKPGGRVYVGYEGVERVLNGLGIAILSTPKGILTDRESRELKVGGEVLCHIW